RFSRTRARLFPVRVSFFRTATLPYGHHRIPVSTRASGVRSERSSSRIGEVEATELGETYHPERGHDDRAHAADQHRRDGPEQRPQQPRLELAELIRRAGEQRVHGAHAAAHAVGVRICTSECRMTTLSRSDAPSTASAASDNIRSVETPNTTVAMPNT